MTEVGLGEVNERRPNAPRSRQAQLRRQAILDAAESLIRGANSTDFTMLKLAECSGVSPTTPYNIFGGKSSILYALLTRSLDSIFSGFGEATAQMEPFEVVVFAGKAAADFFIADPKYYRPLYLYLIGVPDPLYRPPYMNRALNYWRNALLPLQRSGYLEDDRARDALARGLMIQFIGSIDMWAQGELNHEHFRAHIQYGVTALLVHLTRDDWGSLLNNERREALEAMPLKMDFGGQPS